MVKGTEMPNKERRPAEEPEMADTDAGEFPGEADTDTQPAQPITDDDDGVGTEQP
jgi:hypothetical protein